MNRGLYVAASGMLAMQARQDQLSNDLANAATPGYKQDRTAQKAFGELLVRNVRATSRSAPWPPAFASRSRPPISARLRCARPTSRWTSPSTARATSACRPAQGVRYTRNGRFASSADGTLVDQMGNKVLGKDGKPVKLKTDGTVDPAAVGVFALTNLVKSGDGNFTGRSTAQAAGKVRTGELEGSGVDAARTMVEMMASLRAYEAGQKALTTIDDTLGKAAGLGSIR